MTENRKIAVIGAGSWGTALAILLAGKKHDTTLWGHDPKHLERLATDRENKKFLKGAIFPEKLCLESDLEKTIANAEIVVMVVPSHVFREVFARVAIFLNKGTFIISATKGIENDSLLTMTKVMDSILKKSVNAYYSCHLGVLSGPSFADEVARGVPTAVSIAFADLHLAREMQKVFVTHTFRVYASQDVNGLELSGAMKNVIAIGAGVCDGLGYGLNTRAALITRGLAEMKRLGIRLGADADTFSGLSGLGDLVLTCTGNLSRNRNVGLKLGKGQQLSSIVAEMDMVAEGVKTTKSIYQVAKRAGIEMPIAEQMYEILYNDKSCSEAVKDLLARELKVE